MFTNQYSRKRKQWQPSRKEQITAPQREAEHAPEPSKQPRAGFMAELDAWLDEAVFEPIEAAITSEDSKELLIAFNESKQHIKRKVLASYHNGLKASAEIKRNDNDTRNYRRF